MHVKHLLLLLFLVIEWQAADADCRKKLCANSKGIKFEECRNGKGSRGERGTGSRDCEEVKCDKEKEITFTNEAGKKEQWYHVPDAEYIAIAEIDIGAKGSVTITHLRGPDNECKKLILSSEATCRETIIIKLEDLNSEKQKRKFKITAVGKVTIKFKCNKERQCTEVKREQRMKRIVRGDIARAHEFPFMVNLYVLYSTHKSDNNYADCNTFGFTSINDTVENCSDEKPIVPVHCAGSIIERKWVLTAAHCVSATKMIKIKNVETLHYLVGVLAVASDHKRDAADDFESTHWTTPPNVKRNEDFNPKTLDSDIALLSLSQHILPKKGYRYPICLAPSNMDDLAGCEVQGAGWGRKDDNTTSNVLRKGKFKIHDNCDNKITDNMLCFKDDLTNVCNGDSGGPLFCESANDFYYQVGVTSFSQPADKANKADIWKKGGRQGATKIINFLKWIKKIVKDLP